MPIDSSVLLVDCQSNEVITAIVQAAAKAAGMSPEAIRPAITAAFTQAQEAGVDVRAVIAGLRS
jgi:hypothetical protein